MVYAPHARCVYVGLCCKVRLCLSVRVSIYVYAPHPGCGTRLPRPGQAPWAQGPLQETGPVGRCLVVKAVSLKHMHERSSRPTSTCGRRGMGAEGVRLQEGG